MQATRHVNIYRTWRCSNLGVTTVSKPRSLQSLHEMGTGKHDAQKSNSSLEKTLDSLLGPGESAPSEQTPATADAKPSPIDTLRNLLEEELLHAVEDFALRYQEKGIAVSIDCSEFLSGESRTIVVDVGFGSLRCKLEGLVTQDGIAFQESRFVSGVAGTVTAGPMLRLRGLTAELFVNYIYDRTISLVHEAKRSAKT